MFIRLFYLLKRYGIPVSTQALLDLNHAVGQGFAFADKEAFYHLCKLVMIKDEKHYDKFDRAFGEFFDAIDRVDGAALAASINKIPSDWLAKQLEKNLSPAEREALEKMGNLDELLKTLAERLNEQHKRHQGGNRMVGTGGTSPFGAFGDHPEGVRIGGPARKRSAVKVWEQRNYQNLDDNELMGTRQMQVVLRRLRKFARTGAEEELDIDHTIQATAHKGILDIKLTPERRNRVKVLLFFDVGGSMDPYIKLCEAFFSAARSEFKVLEFFYFHNCIYDHVWKNNLRKTSSSMATLELLRTYGPDYRVIVVGDASMAPYELFSDGGSVEYMSEGTGIGWLGQLYQHFSKVAWLNPEDPDYWQHTQTITAIQKTFDGHMYPYTQAGLGDMIKYLAR